MKSAPTSRARSTTRLENIVILMLSRWATDSSIIPCRSSRLKRGSPFWGLRTWAPTTSWNSRDATSMMPRCPLWIGSNEPGYRTVVTDPTVPPAARTTRALARPGQPAAVAEPPPAPPKRPPRRAHDPGTGPARSAGGRREAHPRPSVASLAHELPASGDRDRAVGLDDDELGRQHRQQPLPRRERVGGIAERQVVALGDESRQECPGWAPGAE